MMSKGAWSVILTEEFEVVPPSTTGVHDSESSSAEQLRWYTLDGRLLKVSAVEERCVCAQQSQGDCEVIEALYKAFLLSPLMRLIPYSVRAWTNASICSCVMPWLSRNVENAWA